MIIFNLSYICVSYFNLFEGSELTHSFSSKFIHDTTVIKFWSGNSLGFGLDRIYSTTSLGMTCCVISSYSLVSGAGRVSESILGRSLPLSCSEKIFSLSLLLDGYVSAGFQIGVI